MHGIEGYEIWYDFPNATEALVRRGFAEEDVRKVIGSNFLRVFMKVLE